MSRARLALLVCALLLPQPALAAIAYTGRTASATAGSGATATTGTIAMASGDTIIVVLDDVYSTSGFGYTHTCGDGVNTYGTVLFSKSNYGAGGSSEVWAAFGVAAGTRAVSCSQSGGGAIAIRAAEFSGIGSFDLADGGAAGGASFSSPSVTTTQADELLIGMIGFSSSASTGGGSWIDLGQITDAMIDNMQSSYQIVSSTGSYAYTGTTDNGNARTVIATFKGGTPPVAPHSTSLLLLGAGE